MSDYQAEQDAERESLRYDRKLADQATEMLARNRADEQPKNESMTSYYRAMSNSRLAMELRITATASRKNRFAAAFTAMAAEASRRLDKLTQLEENK